MTFVGSGNVYGHLTKMQLIQQLRGMLKPYHSLTDNEVENLDYNTLKRVRSICMCKLQLKEFGRVLE